MADFDGAYLALINAYIKAGDLDNAKEVGATFRGKESEIEWGDSSCYKTLRKAFEKSNKTARL